MLGGEDLGDENILGSRGEALAMKESLDAGMNVGLDSFAQFVEGDGDISSGRWTTRKKIFLSRARVDRPAIDVEDAIVDEWCGL